MDLHAVLARWRERPFRPFRLIFTDGQTFDVSEPGVIHVTVHEAILLRDFENGIPHHFDLVAWKQVERMDDLPA